MAKERMYPCGREQPLLSSKKLRDTELLLLELPVLYEMLEIWFKLQPILLMLWKSRHCQAWFSQALLSWRLHGLFSVCLCLGRWSKFPFLRTMIILDVGSPRDLLRELAL